MLFVFISSRNTGVPGRPAITGFTEPAMEGEEITLTCTTSGSKPAANIRWFRNDNEVQGKRGSLLLCAHIHALFHCLFLEAVKRCWTDHIKQVTFRNASSRFLF